MSRASELAITKLLQPRDYGVDSGGYAVKVMTLTWGDLALCLKGRREQSRSEKSAEAVVVPFKHGAKGRMKRRA